MAPQKKSELQTWFSQFLRWVKSIINGRRTPTSTVKTRRYSTDRASAVFTLRRDVPGAVETWRIIHSGSTGAILLTLDNLSDSRAYYKTERRKARESGRGYTTTADERGLQMAGGEIHTHRFAFSWIAFDGKRQKVRLLGVYDGDFAAFSKEYAYSIKVRAISTNDDGLKRQMGDRMALKIGEAIALELLELKPLPGFRWENRIASYDWEELLLGYTRRVHRASDFDPKIVCRSR